MDPPLRFSIRPGALTVRVTAGGAVAQPRSGRARHVGPDPDRPVAHRARPTGGGDVSTADPLAAPDPVDPVEERLARRLDEGPQPGTRPVGTLASPRSSHRSAATTASPTRPSPARRLRRSTSPCAACRASPTTPSRGSSWPAPWPCSAAAPGGGPRWAVSLAIGAASLVVNQPMKLRGDRDRPDRDRHAVPSRGGSRCRPPRRSRPGTRRRPLAFAVAVGDVVPALRLAPAARRPARRVLAGPHRRALPGRRARGRGDRRPARTSGHPPVRQETRPSLTGCVTMGT